MSFLLRQSTQKVVLHNRCINNVQRSNTLMLIYYRKYLVHLAHCFRCKQVSMILLLETINIIGFIMFCCYRRSHGNVSKMLYVFLQKCQLCPKCLSHMQRDILKSVLRENLRRGEFTMAFPYVNMEKVNTWTIIRLLVPQKLKHWSLNEVQWNLTSLPT